MEAKTPLQRVLDLKTATELARNINRRQSTVWEWVKRGWVAPDACAAIAAAVNHAVTEEELLKSAADMKAAARAAAGRKAA